MAAKNGYTIEEKIVEVERLLDFGEVPTTTEEARRRNVLMAVAADLRARIDYIPSATLVSLGLRVGNLQRSKTALGYSHNHMIGLAQELIGKWPVVRQSLELFGALVESGEPPLKAAFDLGFEHAVAGGDEMAKKAGIPPHLLPLVMYFLTEEDRREMIDAVAIAKPDMIKMKIPERTKR